MMPCHALNTFLTVWHFKPYVFVWFVRLFVRLFVKISFNPLEPKGSISGPLEIN